MAIPSPRASTLLAGFLMSAAVPAALAAPALAGDVAPAAAAQTAIAAGASGVAGVVDDSQTSLPLPGVTVRVPGTDRSAVTDRSGGFALTGLAPGTYTVRIELPGYQPTDTQPLTLGYGATAEVTLAMQRVTQGAATGLRTIGATSTNASQSLQRSSTIYRNVAPEAQLQAGLFRIGDALRELPGVNNGIAGDTAALGDDLQLNVRGLGTAETLAELDGHPIGQGVPGGFNYQLSPAFGIRNVLVTYGSGGGDLTGYDAIGGTIDSRTIDPTPDFRFTASQGAGTFARQLTSLQATGTYERLGYALSYGVGSVDGPFDNQHLYQPGAAYDPSATSAAVRSLGVYKDDSAAISRSGLAKLRVGLDAHDATHLTFTSVNSSYWEDKTGNGDGDYLDSTVALATGNGLLAAKAASDACPAGRFTATNANGVPFGTGPGGVPDGGSACQTPASYASATTGYQGAGTAWQSFDFNDSSVRLDTAGPKHATRVEAFTNRYLNSVSRAFRLPFAATPGDAGGYGNTTVNTTGVIASDDLVGANNDFGFGAQYTNYAYALFTNQTLTGAPIVHEQTEFVREAYHPQRSPFSAYANAFFKRNTTTQSSFVDPRLSLVFTSPGKSDVLRLSEGATTTEPLANQLDQVFAANTLVTAGGGGGISCTTPNAVGSAPSSVLKPERGVDTELSYGHRFSGDSQIQAVLYNTNVYDKIFSSIAPLSTTGTGFIDPAILAQDIAAVTSRCGNVAPLALLGVSGPVNLGQLRASGIDVSGRQRIDRATYVDYDYDVDSNTIVSASPLFYEQNLAYVQGAQLPRLPLHTFAFSADRTFARGLDVRYTVHGFSENNTKRLPAYNYSDLRLTAPAGPGAFTAYVSNLFEQNAFIQGYLGEGQPLALNANATAADYRPYLGTAATERFGLPYRSIYFSYGVAL